MLQFATHCGGGKCQLTYTPHHHCDLQTIRSLWHCGKSRQVLSAAAVLAIPAVAFCQVLLPLAGSTSLMLAFLEKFSREAHWPLESHWWEVCGLFLQDLWWLSTRRYFIKWPGRAKRWWNIIQKGNFCQKSFSLMQGVNFILTAWSQNAMRTWMIWIALMVILMMTVTHVLMTGQKLRAVVWMQWHLMPSIAQILSRWHMWGLVPTQGPESTLVLLSRAILLRKYHHYSSTML